MHIFLYDEYRISQRASWVVSFCIEHHPAFAKAYLPVMLYNLQNPMHDAVVRNTIRILQFVDIPERLHAKSDKHLF